ncbi:MAG: fluoride efflux transporter CrcB [Candidatus Kappaea frigidicola]|nr:fluoride efflux transporter CrcB [Candidatus Kappaea frigidicola]
MVKIISLVVGGALGTTLRYFFSGAIYKITGPDFPYGTLAVNIAGCFIIGFLVSITETKFILGPNSKVLLMVGFCGAFTTFSTFILETANLMKDGQISRAFLNLFISLVLGFVFLRAGMIMGEVL